MASNYEKNRWELYNPEIPNEQQPHSFITKRKLDKIEKGIEEASIELEVGTIDIGDDYDVNIVEDLENKTRKLNFVFPPAGKGQAGEDGKSAYDIWLEAGNIGTEQEFLDYLKGIDGKDGKDGIDGKDGAQGPAGDSAYQIWISQGNTGSVQDFLESIKGNGGKSTYDIWLELGNSGTAKDFLESLKGKQGESGEDGEDGESAYELWKSIPGNENKSITEFFESLKGEKGDSGSEANFVDF